MFQTNLLEHDGFFNILKLLSNDSRSFNLKIIHHNVLELSMFCCDSVCLKLVNVLKE